MAYRPRATPLSTTDAIIEYGSGPQPSIILITRKNPPYGLALPGGFHECGLTLEENAIKEVYEETGLRFRIENPGRPWTYSAPDRDPRGHMIAHVFYGRGTGRLRHGDDADSVRARSIEDVRTLLTLHKRGLGGPCRLSVDPGKEYPIGVHLTRGPVFAFDHARILDEFLRWRYGA